MTENIKLPHLNPETLQNKNKIDKKMITQDHTNKQKQCNSQESSDILNKSCSIEIMDIENNNIIANLQLAGI